MSFVSGFRVSKRSMGLVGLLLVLATVVTPMAASAHYLGGSWFYNRTFLLPLSYSNQAGGFPAYSSAITQGASNWYSTATPSDLYSTRVAVKVFANRVNEPSSR